MGNRAGSSPVTRTKKEALAKPVLLFWVPPPFGRLHPVYFICSGRVNRPGIKIFAYGKNAWNAALAADFSPTSGLTLLAKKKDIPLGMSFFLGSSAFGRLHPIYFICSGGINPPGIKIFAMPKCLTRRTRGGFFLRLRV
ncbi:hypothetical protein GMD88_00120 [Pseudoflavonifractor sp. BIOML-A6]|nr:MULTISPECIES: hypothetical protein [unclassified Pseudoflavonifractor]MTQ97818.1 hypothetical protein [Pseudoflavonifractor sp. BIOML-A16]MTR04504.1 hypothetical protein [Pseudoflavonifractor sp. BIOML-A15]MTR33596.1 hypothetical protein [Pseudoflavonifractor sp. BIOML-A14]MTR71813.1 hypothetical protein [Pseudoflavonifractor sp. BIOML-A18]MTS62644.1 hypothetical protein [Pseudoflavonifractor sp. BIOML-A5]MTS71762.1 hypothetical protein [Pseudoflavonifractor sp. BIOML-A8]MTS89816.1 hypoth